MKFPISHFVVYGNSMFPILKPGQHIISFNWVFLIREPKIGELVVIKVKGKDMVKRIQKVSDRDIFVLGDNETESTDSRQFGAISKSQIVGKVILSYN